MKIFLIAGAMLVGAFVTQPSIAQFKPFPCEDHGFRGDAALNESELKPEFGNSILRLKLTSETGTTLGTAFLIDRQSGLFLTANHLIDDDPSSIKGDRPFISKNDSFDLTPAPLFKHGWRFPAKSDSDEPDEWVDAAILKLEKPDDLVFFANAREFDIEFENPVEGKKVFSLGYPKPIAEDRTAELEAWGMQVGVIRQDLYKDTDINIYKFERSTQDGESGGPLLNVHEKVIGIAMQRERELGYSHFTRLYDAQYLLSQLPMTEGAQTLDNIVRSQTLNMQSLKSTLRASSLGFRNIDLYSWALHRDKANFDYSRLDDSLKCTIIMAYAARGMGIVSTTYLPDLQNPILTSATLGVMHASARSSGDTAAAGEYIVANTKVLSERTLYDRLFDNREFEYKYNEKDQLVAIGGGSEGIFETVSDLVVPAATKPSERIIFKSNSEIRNIQVFETQKKFEKFQVAPITEPDAS